MCWQSVHGRKFADNSISLRSVVDCLQACGQLIVLLEVNDGQNGQTMGSCTESNNWLSASIKKNEDVFVLFSNNLALLL